MYAPLSDGTKVKFRNSAAAGIRTRQHMLRYQLVALREGNKVLVTGGAPGSGIEKGAASSRKRHAQTGRHPPFDRCRSANRIAMSRPLLHAKIRFPGKGLNFTFL